MSGLLRRDLLTAGLGLGLVSCAPHQRGLRGSTLKIAVVSSFSGQHVRLTGLDYAIEKEGWLRQELSKRGINFAWFPAPNAAVGPIVNEAFASRQIQFAGYSDLPSIILNASGAAEKTKLVVPGSPSDSYLVVPANSTAKSIEDLKGKRLAIHRGRPWELPLLRLLQTHGLSYHDFQIYNINPEAGAAAVVSGGVDALFTISPYSLVERGVAKIIWSTTDLPLSWKGWGGTWVARSLLAKDPDVAQLVVTAYVKAAHWVSLPEHKDEIIHQGTLNGTPESIVRRTYDAGNISWKDRWSPLFPPELYEHYRQAVAFARQNGIIKADVDVNALLDDQLAQTALKQLNLTNYWTLPSVTGRRSPTTPT